MKNVNQDGFAPAPADENAPYFSERLKAKLRRASGMRGILIEAPSGYGKTTVAEKFLLEALPKKTSKACHRCEKESSPAVWRGLCRALSAFDAKTGMELLRLGLPDPDSAGDAGRYLRGVECAAPTWLVLDDFHNLAPLAPASVWEALLDHECPHLCVVLIAQPLPESPMPDENRGFLRLGADDLRLTEQESGEYAAQAGVTLDREEAKELYRRTEGWMFPLVLEARYHRETKTFAPPSDFDGLVRNAIWNKLDDAGRDFLWRLSPVDHFSHEEASFFLGGQAPPAEAIAFLRQHAALRFEAASGLYYPHGLLLEFTRARFAEQPESARRTMLQAAADWYAANGERKKAVALYYQLENFEKILALDLSDFEDNRLLDLPDDAPDRRGSTPADAAARPVETYAEALRKIAAHCDRAMKARHPLSAIQVVFEFFGAGLIEEYAALCEEMAEVVETAGPERERDYLRGELRLMEAFLHYNDIAAMGECIQRASELTGGGTSLISPDQSWTFGNASVLFMYHRESGRLDAELADMER
jgi:LuxR family maltose regulon positive regulatory protein